MSFLTDQNLTFHRFSDGTLSLEGMKSRKISSNEIPYDDTKVKRKVSNLSDYHPASELQSTVWTTRTKYNYNANHPDLLANETATSTARIIPDDNNGTLNVTTPSTLNEFQYIPSSCNNSTHHNGSTMKLITVTKDDSDLSSSSNQQVS
jgi:hypothetical protein